MNVFITNLDYHTLDEVRERFPVPEDNPTMFDYSKRIDAISKER